MIAYNHYLSWTKCDDDYLKELKEAGCKPNVIAFHLGRTVSAVYLRLWKLRLTNGRWTEEEDETVREMREDGSTAAEIADILGRSKYSVYMRIHKLKIPKARSSLLYKWLPIIKDWKGSIRGLAKEEGVSFHTIRKAKKQLRERGLL